MIPSYTYLRLCYGIMVWHLDKVCETVTRCDSNSLHRIDCIHWFHHIYSIHCDSGIIIIVIVIATLTVIFSPWHNHSDTRCHNLSWFVTVCHGLSRCHSVSHFVTLFHKVWKDVIQCVMVWICDDVKMWQCVSLMVWHCDSVTMCRCYGVTQWHHNMVCVTVWHGEIV